MSSITNEFMMKMISTTRSYALVILRSGPVPEHENAQDIVWEHGRRNFELREKGLLSIVCPVSDDSGVAGICIFNTGVEEARTIMNDDPGVQAGIFTYEVHECRSFPGDCLP